MCFRKFSNQLFESSFLNFNHYCIISEKFQKKVLPILPNSQDKSLVESNKLLETKKSIEASHQKLFCEKKVFLKILQNF